MLNIGQTDKNLNIHYFTDILVNLITKQLVSSVETFINPQRG
jgi:hypothetical protein